MATRQLTTKQIVNLASDPVSGTPGEIYYNTSSNTFKYYNGTTWVAISSGGGDSLPSQTGNSGNYLTTNGTTASWASIAEDVQDTVGGMVSGNTESGISVTYDDETGKLNFDVNDPTITLTGDITGSATMTNLGNVSITTTVAANSVELGVDTFGQYVASVSGTTNQVNVSGSGTESITLTLSTPQDIHSGASPIFAGATLDSVRIGITAANEIDTSSGNLIIDSAGGTVTVDDNLSVTGTVTAPTLTLTTSDTATAASHYFVETASDGIVRPKTLADVRTEIVTTSTVNAAAATTLGTVTSGTWNATAIAVARGGTGLTTSPTNGQLLVGNGTGYTLATITQGAGITVTNGAGSISVANAGVTSLSGTTNQITASASTGSVTLSLPSAVTFPGTVTLNADPSQPLQAATKQYVDAVAQGLHIHASAQTATTANIANLAAAPATIDGVTLTNGMRVLVKNQSTTSQNGIYVFNAGALTRATDFDSSAEIQGGDFIFVTGGTINNDTGWVQTETVTTVGTGPILFQQFSGAGTYTAGNGLTLTGSQFSINTGVTADLSTAQTLTNKTINGANNTLTVRLANDITGFGTGIATFLATPTSANLAAAVTDETGSGALVFATSPSLTTPNIGAASGTSLSVTGNVSGSTLTSTVATGTAPLTVTSTTVVTNLNADLLDGTDSKVYIEGLRANRNITGGGIIAVDGSYNIKWSARFLVLANGRSSTTATSGYWDINMPAQGTTITGAGGATNQTVGASGIPLSTWTALYYILPFGSNEVTVAANFRLVSYTQNLDVPANWVLLAWRNGDSNYIYFNNGIILAAGESSVSVTTSANTANSVVKRDGSGNFSAGSPTFNGTIIAPAATTSISSIRLPHGTAPAAPTNGDIWTTTSGLFARINSTTIGPFGQGNQYYQANSPSAPAIGDIWVESDVDVSETTYHAAYSADAPTGPIIGDLWIESDVDSDVFQPTVVTRYTENVSSSKTLFNSGFTYQVGYEQVFLNGVLLARNSDYTATNGTSVTLAETTRAGDVVEIISTTTINLTDTYTQTQVDTFLALKSNIASPTFTGIPAAPTAAADTNTTQIATTAFVIGQAASANPSALGSVAVGTSARYARADHVHPTTGLGLTSGTLAQFSATTSAQLAGVISDETGSGSLVFGTSPTLSTPVMLSPEERCNIVAAAATGTINFDTLTSTIWFYTSNATADHTLNFRGNSGTTLNSILAVGDSISLIWLNTNGGTAYRPTTFQIDGVSVTPRWSGGTAPTAGNANSIDAYSFSIIKTAASTYTVLAGQSRFA